MTHDEEQKLLKDEFTKTLKAIDQDDDDEVFTLRKKTQADLQRESAGMEEFKQDLKERQKRRRGKMSSSWTG